MTTTTLKITGSNQFPGITKTRYYGISRRIISKDAIFKKAAISAKLGHGSARPYENTKHLYFDSKQGCNTGYS